MAFAPDEHAVVTVTLGPRVLNLMAMLEDDALYIDFGIAIADLRPWPLEKNAPQNSSIDRCPPKPVPRITPTSYPSIWPFWSPASETARWVPAIASCETRSSRAISRSSKKLEALNSRQIPAMVVLRRDVSNSFIGPMPLRPSASADQTASRPIPTGVMRPIPVIATRLKGILKYTRQTEAEDRLRVSHLPVNERLVQARGSVDQFQPL